MDVAPVAVTGKSSVAGESAEVGDNLINWATLGMALTITVAW
jgi:hypothetical protein